MNELVERLSTIQSVKAEGQDATLKDLRERVKSGYIEIIFTKTGTGLGMDLYEPECSIDKDMIKKGKGSITTTGYFTLNYDKVKCTANIDLETLEGTACLTPVDDEKYKMVMKAYKAKDPYS